MAGYRGFEKKKSKLGTTLLIVGVIHVGIAAGLYWVSQTEWGQNLIKVYKLTAFEKKEPPPPPEKEPEPEPEPPKPEPKPEAPMPEPEPQEAPPPPPPVTEAPPPQVASLPPPTGPDSFAIGKSRNRFAGYSDILTAMIQAKYQQPPSLPDDLEYAVLCELVLDEQGRVLQYRLVNSSGSLLFDQSALDALSKLTQVRPPPEGMDRTVIVKFFPPS
ncbi:MAG: TonB C-terminal domain-containing protein [Nitrospira sp.]|nr:TonB C-terminal domain-containing protein [Nitrospira sp.]MCP9476072.1 TonB C-terminal domain-containing protein [Nitrospira sp.]